MRGWESSFQLERLESWEHGGLLSLGWEKGLNAGDLVSNWGERNFLGGHLVLETGKHP